MCIVYKFINNPFYIIKKFKIKLNDSRSYNMFINEIKVSKLL